MTSDPWCGGRQSYAARTSNSACSNLGNVKTQVVVVGAGLAGLAAAIELHGRGVEVLLLEADDAVGGRVRTDVVDGFRLDRGFQVINPYYPELRRLEVIDELDIRPLAAGVLVSMQEKLWPLGDPRREPQWALSSAYAPVGSVQDKARLVLYALHCDRSPVEELIFQDDSDFASALLSAGIGKRLYESTLRPFLTGVFLCDPSEVSRRYGELVLRSFVRGTPSLPALGVGELPLALARRLPEGTIKTNVTVTAINGSNLTTDQGPVEADAVILAVDPNSVPDLVDGYREVPTLSCTTWYHAADQAPTSQRAVVVDGRSRGPIVNTVVLSNVSDGYAPDGKTLISTTTLGTATGGEDEARVRAQLRIMWGVDTSAWELIAPVAVPMALPRQIPGQEVRQPQKYAERIWLAGDYLDTPSQQGALVSGRRAAREVHETLLAR